MPNEPFSKDLTHNIMYRSIPHFTDFEVYTSHNIWRGIQYFNGNNSTNGYESLEIPPLLASYVFIS